MRNGMMNESINKTATLADLGPTTFVQFAEFCCFENYRSALKMISGITKSSDIKSNTVRA